MPSPSEPSITPAIVAVCAAVVVLGVCLVSGLLQPSDAIGVRGVLIGGAAAGAGYLVARTFLDWDRPRK